MKYGKVELKGLENAEALSVDSNGEIVPVNLQTQINSLEDSKYDKDGGIVTGTVTVSGSSYGLIETITPSASASLTPNFDSGNYHTLTLEANSTLENPTLNPLSSNFGQAGVIEVNQPPGDNYTLSFGSNYVFVNVTPPTITATNGAKDVLCYQVLSSSLILITQLENIS